MTRLSRRPLASTLPLLLLASLFLNACSSGGGDGSAGTPPGSPPPSGPTPPPPVAGLVQQGYLKASNTGANDNLGFNVVLSGDTLVVGAPQEGSSATGVNGDQANNNAQNSGAVYVFTRTGGVWTQQAYLKASNTDASDQFGVGVAISGDTLAVGAQFEASNATGINGDQTNNSAPQAGAVYVFTRTAGVWSQQAYLKGHNTEAGDQFGVSVAVEGDTLAVGAIAEASNATGVNHDGSNNNAPGSGAVYVFTRTAGVWSQQAYVKASNAGGLFGNSVALAGDTLAVGAQFEASNATGVNGNQTDTSAPLAGAVYVFTRTGGNWSQQAYVKASNTDAEDRFGEDVALDGDTLVVGARFEASAASGVNADQTDNSATNAGAAYVFTRTAGVWSQQAYLKASNAGTGKNFAGTITIAGNIVAVGSRLEDSNATGINGNQGNNGASDSGAVYVFKRTAGVWEQTDYLKASNTNAGDQFGDAVAISGNTLAIGAWFEGSSATGVNGNQADNNAPNSGAVYVFDGL
jgi:hypothetical protein